MIIGCLIFQMQWQAFKSLYPRIIHQIILDSMIRPLECQKPLRFFHHLLAHPDFRAIVAETWEQTPTSAPKMICISFKLKVLKGKLTALNRSAYSGIQLRFAEALIALKQAQHSFLSDPSHAAA